MVSRLRLALPLSCLLAPVPGCTETQGPSLPPGCTAQVQPSDDDQGTLQLALLEIEAGGVLCLADGEYRMTGELSLAVPSVTVKGAHDDRDAVTLSWADQVTGANGFNVTGDDFTIEHLTIADVRGDGIRASGVDGLTFRDLHVLWSAGPHPDNGAYAIFPVQSSNILVEELEVEGAADAGLYIGQSHHVVLRNNHLHHNVDGISIENSSDVEIHDNDVHDNAGGIVVFNLPDLPVQGGSRVLVHDNAFYDNNGTNFGPPGQIVAVVPSGTGIIVLAADQIEVRDNVFRNNRSIGAMLVSYDTISLVAGFPQDDPSYDPYGDDVYFHDNMFTDNGYDPQDMVGEILVSVGLTQLEDLTWDGALGPMASPDDAPVLCLQEPGASFRNLDVPGGFADQSTDLAPHDCEFPALPPIEL